MFSYGQRSECADLLNSYSDFYYLVKKVMEELHRQIYSGLPVMWKPAVSGMEKVRIRTILSYWRIRRYLVLPFKTAEKHVALAM